MGLITNPISIMAEENVTRKGTRFKHLDARVTPEEYAQAKEKADACGMSLSEYTRKCTLGHEPKLHLTQREIETYNSLSDARGDIVHIRSALHGKSQEQIRSYFANDRFMRAWIEAATKIIVQWDSILAGMRE